MDFLYSKDISEYKMLLNKSLEDFECKHIINENNNISLHQWAKKVNYPYIIFGSHRINPSINKETLIIDIMKKDLAFNRPIGITITDDNRVWCDNTHTMIAYIYRGRRLLKEIPFYIVDCRKKVVKIIDYKNSIIPNLDNINKAINSAYSIQRRIDIKSLDNISWKIIDLINLLEQYILKKVR